MVDVSCLVQTWAPAISRAGTGHLIGERLVLTAWHTTGDQTHPECDGLQVRVFDPHGHTKWMRAQRIWPAESPDIDARPDLDVALVQIDDPDWVPPVGLVPVRFGQITGTRAITCRAVGFPRAEARPDEPRGTKDIEGRSEPLTALGQGLIVFTVTNAIPTPGGWAGGSGAALHCENLITGVLVEDRADYRGTQLRAADLAHLAEHTNLPQALHAAGVTLTFYDATAPPDPPPDESAVVLDGLPPRVAFPRKAHLAIIITVGALILALRLLSLPHDGNTANSGHGGANGPPNSATTDGQRDSTSTTEVTSPTVTKIPVQPGHLPDPCQAATAPTVSEFGLGAGKSMAGTPAPTKSCGWATTNNVNGRSYRLIAVYYVTGEGTLGREFTPAPVSLPGVKAFQHSDGLSCQLAWTTSFGAIVVMVGHNIYAPASTAPDMCTVAATWSTAIFPNLPG